VAQPAALGQAGPATQASASEDAEVLIRGTNTAWRLEAAADERGRLLVVLRWQRPSRPRPTTIEEEQLAWFLRETSRVGLPVVVLGPSPSSEQSGQAVALIDPVRAQSAPLAELRAEGTVPGGTGGC
jgi:hypothetical protein